MANSAPETEPANRQTPLFKVVRDALRRAIDEGEYDNGDLIPPEPALCELYGVSRITVRRAVAELTSEGLLEKVPGKGTYVRSSVFTWLAGRRIALSTCGEACWKGMSR